MTWRAISGRPYRGGRHVVAHHGDGEVAVVAPAPAERQVQVRRRHGLGRGRPPHLTRLRRADVVLRETILQQSRGRLAVGRRRRRACAYVSDSRQGPQLPGCHRHGLGRGRPPHLTMSRRRRLGGTARATQGHRRRLGAHVSDSRWRGSQPGGGGGGGGGGGKGNAVGPRGVGAEQQLPQRRRGGRRAHHRVTSSAPPLRDRASPAPAPAPRHV